MSALSFRLLLPFLVPLLLGGCASEGVFTRRDTPCVGDDCIGPQFVQFERGQPNVVVDSVGWVFGIPNRILLWNWRVQNHDVSPQTEQQLRRYVAANELDDVKVRLNQYDPGGEWQRLARNDRVGAGWRYTIGALGTLGYTIFPGRIFAIDYYNPFTNTVNVYSDVPALGMKEIAYAGDVIDRNLPGTYAFSQMIPGVNLVHETITTREVLDYVHVAGDPDLRRESVHVLYPSYGGAVGGAFDAFLPTAPVLQLGGLVVGHVNGRWETRGWEARDPTMLSGTATESAPTEIRLTPPQELFAAGALPVGPGRTVSSGEIASTPAAVAESPADLEPAGEAKQASHTESVAAGEPASDAGPSTADDDADDGVVTAGYEEAVDMSAEEGVD